MNEVNLRKCERARVLNTTRQYLILDRHILYYLHTPIAHTKCTRITFYNKEGHPDRAAGRQARRQAGRQAGTDGKISQIFGYVCTYACMCVRERVSAKRIYIFIQRIQYGSTM